MARGYPSYGSPFFSARSSQQNYADAASLTSQDPVIGNRITPTTGVSVNPSPFKKIHLTKHQNHKSNHKSIAQKIESLYKSIEATLRPDSRLNPDVIARYGYPTNILVVPSEKKGLAAYYQYPSSIIKPTSTDLYTQRQYAKYGHYTLFRPQGKSNLYPIVGNPATKFQEAFNFRTRKILAAAYQSGLTTARTRGTIYNFNSPYSPEIKKRFALK